MIGAALELVASAVDGFGTLDGKLFLGAVVENQYHTAIYLPSEPTLAVQGIQPVTSEAHDVAMHLDNPGLFEHRQIAPADITRARTVEHVCYLPQGGAPAGGVQGVEDGPANLAQPLYAVSALGLWRLAHLAGV